MSLKAKPVEEVPELTVEMALLQTMSGKLKRGQNLAKQPMLAHIASPKRLAMNAFWAFRSPLSTLFICPFLIICMTS